MVDRNADLQNPTDRPRHFEKNHRSLRNNAILLGILLSVLVHHAVGQSYVPMPVADATWTVLEYGYGTFPPELGVTHYGLNGDTVIGTEVYHKVYRNLGALGLLNVEPVFNPLTAQYFGAFREDAERKVWFWGIFAADEVLMYDFGLSVGESFCFDDAPCGVQCHQVDSIDSIEVDGTMRSRIHFSYNGQQQVWMEGIGSVHEPWSSLWCYIGNFEWQLNCFSQSGIPVYGDCTYPTGLNHEPVTDEKELVYPNPVTDMLTIETPTARSEWVLEDVTGRAMLWISILESSSQTDLSLLPAGAYVLRRIDKGESFRQRLLKL